ncbi:MAG: minor capsid protein [Anaerolineae bacterium]|nr:minor capsid protein [Phycisphaerae bacterium]
MQSRLDLDEGKIDSLRKLYETPALRVTDQAATALENRLQRTLLTTTQQGLGVREGTKALRHAFEDEGFAPEENYRLEAMFRTQTQIAYSAGRENSLSDPAIQEILWGFEFAAIQDDRTTELCISLDGMRRPKDDPVWKTYTPPNHYNCRSTVIEIFDEEDATPVPAGLKPVEGFGINFGRVFADSISSASELVTT